MSTLEIKEKVNINQTLDELKISYLNFVQWNVSRIWLALIELYENKKDTLTPNQIQKLWLLLLNPYRIEKEYLELSSSWFNINTDLSKIIEIMINTINANDPKPNLQLNNDEILQDTILNNLWKIHKKIQNFTTTEIEELFSLNFQTINSNFINKIIKKLKGKKINFNEIINILNHIDHVLSNIFFFYNIEIVFLKGYMEDKIKFTKPKIWPINSSWWIKITRSGRRRNGLSREDKPIYQDYTWQDYEKEWEERQIEQISEKIQNKKIQLIEEIWPKILAIIDLNDDIETIVTNINELEQEEINKILKWNN